MFLMPVNGSDYFEIFRKPVFTCSCYQHKNKLDFFWVEEILRAAATYFLTHLKTGLKIAVVFNLVSA